MDHITTDATEYERKPRQIEFWVACLTSFDSNMIDVLHPGNTELSQRFAVTSSQRSTPRTGTPETPADNVEETQDEESAWLQSVQAANASVVAVKGLESGSLVLDISQLRTEPPTSAPRKTTRGKLLA